MAGKERDAVLDRLGRLKAHGERGDAIALELRSHDLFHLGLGGKRCDHQTHESH